LVQRVKIKAECREKRVGLLGGTFNPIHVGHLRGAEEIREAFDLEKVIFIPASVPPHKGMERLMDASHRLEMVRLALRSNPAFSISDIELKRSGKSYSVDTIRYFKDLYPGPLFFILGEDAFFEIEAWREFKDLFSLCHFVVMSRPGFQKAGLELPESLVPFFRREARGRWTHISGHCLYLQEITLLDISSTRIRERIKRGNSVRYLLPAEVEAYIDGKGLYRKN